ncbi:hypothetical protein DM02DRAFT_34673 [Periconia macrospinosa]|uniref:Uncharacterized protein n=1 Tax=Periconia macrospinosa TaxID=97972 RepID=A0A2V1E6J5_9PLEO|nr:hypothetical protein DM02DRAFT_34673 [Periconia macrospinosa]
MAHSSKSHAIMAELGGNHRPDHKLAYDTPSKSHQSGKHCDASTSKTTHTTEGSGGDLASEEASNGDEDADSSATQGDEQDDEDEEEPEVFAPSHGRGKGKGKGKGKRPAIRVEPVDDESEMEENDTVTLETGLYPGKHPVKQLFTTNKKRTFSNVSNTSLLFGDDESEKSFPRRKIARKLSNSSIKSLLKYKENANEAMENSENAIESDDEDYSGVNLVPDDDDDYEQEEESFLIQEAMEDSNSFNTLMNNFNDARRLSLDSHVSDSIFDMTAPLSGAYLEDMNLPDHGFGQFFEPEPLPPSPDPIAKRKYSDSSTKRVRFDDEVQMSDSSSASSSELDSSLYPDLFLEQDKLPPSLSQLLDIDYDEDNGDYDSPGSEMSFWDFAQEETVQSAPTRPNPLKAARELEDDESSDPGSSGYETDIGDTTDEYESDMESLANPQTPVQNKSVLHKPSSAPASRVSSPMPFARSSKPSGSKPTGRAIPPTRGIFIHDDSSKAIAVTNRKTKTLTFYRPRASTNPWVTSFGPQSSSNSTTNSPRASLQQYNNGSDSEVSNEMFNNPFTTDIMLTGIFGAAPTDEFFFGADSVGPPEAFYPFVSVGTNGTIMDEEGEYDEEEDYEDDLNITDFMDFGDDADATDVDQEDEETDAPATPATSTMAMNGSTPAHPTPMTQTPANRKRNASDAMLQHFDRGVVTAFRNNQSRYRDVACLPSDPTIRASVSKPIRSGKSAEQLMTPLRKRSGPRRTAKSPFQPSSPMVHASSPLSSVARASSRLHNSVLTSNRAPKMGTFS